MEGKLLSVDPFKRLDGSLRESRRLKRIDLRKKNIPKHLFRQTDEDSVTRRRDVKRGVGGGGNCRPTRVFNSRVNSSGAFTGAALTLRKHGTAASNVEAAI